VPALLPFKTFRWDYASGSYLASFNFTRNKLCKHRYLHWCFSPSRKMQTLLSAPIARPPKWRTPAVLRVAARFDVVVQAAAAKASYLTQCTRLR